MIETMVEYHGVGLAAPQVHEGVRLFVASLDARRRTTTRIAEPLAGHQPGDRRSAAMSVEDWEGCLSIPDIRGRVPRAREIKRAGARPARRAIELRAQDFPARVIQHETDHLDGVAVLRPDAVVRAR